MDAGAYYRESGNRQFTPPPGVGASSGGVFALQRDYSLNRDAQGWRAAKNMARYMLFKTGPMTSTYDINAFIKTCPALKQPDAQILFWNLTVDKSVLDTIKVEDHPGLLVMGYPLRTSSEGSIRLRSADPADRPVIHTNFLATEHDRSVMVGMFRYVRRLFSHPLLAAFIAEETYPGRSVESDEDILDAARRDQTCQHAVGTYRMGTGALAVLDPSLRVRGVQGLRVVDLSAMPTQVSGNTNGPVMAFSWQASKLIREDRN